MTYTRSSPHMAFASRRRAAPRSPLPVRVAFGITLMDVGGTELNAVRTAERLDRSEFEPLVVSLSERGPLLDRYRSAGIEVASFRVGSLTAPSALREARRLYHFLRERRIGVFHCHDVYSNVFGAPVARLARVPAIIASRRWMHRLEDRRLELANRAAYRFADCVLANSGAVAQRVRDYDGVAAHRVVEVSNFVDECAFRPLPPRARAALRGELGVPSDALVLGCIARLVPVKGHATLLRAVAALAPRWPSLHLILVGDGVEREALDRLAADLQIEDRVHFAGQRPNTPNLHALFEVSVLASLSEGFPNSLVEAMAAARPVVATDVGGNPDAIRPGTGLLVPPSDPTALAAALHRLLGDEQARARMGEAALQRARSEYHADAVLPRLESIYRQLLSRSRR